MAEASAGDRRDDTEELISLVIPVYNEADNILPLLERLSSNVKGPHETLLVYDFEEDTTIPPARHFSKRYAQLRLVHNTIAPGVLNALRAGIAAANGDVVVVTMADLSDDVTQIDEMAGYIHDGAGLVAASRYMRGGHQVGGPPVKRFLSRMAGLSLHWLTRIDTHDATNNFKAYARELLDEVNIESTSGFELGLELTTKAHLLGYDIAEIPTTWRDRSAGESRFRVLKWMPGYLRWYLRCVVGSWAGRRRKARWTRASMAGPSPTR